MRSALFIVLWSVICTNIFAQETDWRDSQPYDKVIFQDDFSNDSIGSFPAKWRQFPCNKFDYQSQFDYHQYWKVERQDDAHVLGIYTTNMIIEPDINEQRYLPEKFAVEFDFIFDTSGCMELNFYTDDRPDSCSMKRFHVVSNGQVRETGYRESDGNILWRTVPETLMHHIRHHFALAYSNRKMDMYVDQYRVLSFVDCGFTPYGLSLSCIAPVKYAAFSITTGKPVNSFSKILTSKKMVTHDVHFDVGKAIIQEQSKDYISQLASFMKSNPTVKLEIDGHTDSDGDSVANMSLSLARAIAVASELAKFGIAKERLTTRGFGPTKPLQPNDTPAGKAENRRVEFVNLTK